MLLVDHKKLWDDALADIELNVSKANFGTWFKNTNIVRQESGIVYLNVPNAFVKEWLVNKYHKFIVKSLRDLHSEIRGVEYLISKVDEPGKEKRETGFEKSIYTEQLAMQELYINKEDNLNPRYIFDSFIVGPFNELAHAAAQAVVRKLGGLYNPLYIYGGTGLGKTHLT